MRKPVWGRSFVNMGENHSNVENISRPVQDLILGGKKNKQKKPQQLAPLTLTLTLEDNDEKYQCYYIMISGSRCHIAQL